MGRLEGGGDETIIGRDREEAGQFRAPPASPEAARAGEKLDPFYSQSTPIPCVLRHCRNRATYVAVTAVVMRRADRVYHALAVENDLWTHLLGWNHILQRPSDTELRKDFLEYDETLYVFQNVFVYLYKHMYT